MCKLGEISTVVDYPASTKVERGLCIKVIVFYANVLCKIINLIRLWVDFDSIICQYDFENCMFCSWLKTPGFITMIAVAFSFINHCTFRELTVNSYILKLKQIQGGAIFPWHGAFGHDGYVYVFLVQPCLKCASVVFWYLIACAKTSSFPFVNSIAVFYSSLKCAFVIWYLLW